jgi:hypothetical protein
MQKWKLLAAAVVCAALAPAQFYSMYGPQSSLVDAGLANMRYLMNQQSLVMTRAYLAQAQRRLAAGGRQEAPSRPPAVPKDFTFRWQGRLLSMDELARAVSPDPAQQGQVAREFETLVTTVAEDLGKDGTPYDMAKAFALFTATMYSVLHPETDLNEAVIGRLRLQFRTDLLDEASFRQSPPATLQKQWETLLALSGWTLMSNALASQRKDVQLARSLRSAAERGLQVVFQVPASRLRIDPGADPPLLQTEGPAAAPASGWGGGAPAQQAVPASGWGAPAPQASSPALQGNLIRVGHHHFLTGMHPAELRLEAGELVFDPLGHSCSQPALRAPYADIEVREPAVNGNEELLLNVRIRDPKNPKKTLNFNFVSPDSFIDETSGAPVVRSPAGAIEQLRSIAAALRARGAR